MKTPIRRKLGMALVIVLSFVVMITIMVLALMTSMRLDRPAARSFLDRTKAQQFAQMGIDSVVGTMRRYTADPNANWITKPGQLVTSSGSSLRLMNEIPLFSGNATADFNNLTGALRPPNLNIPTFKDPGTYLLTDPPTSGGNATLMPVSWIYVRRDGSLDTNASPGLSNTNNPIVGRYAYWADDESSKVNYNIAWGRPVQNTGAQGLPTRVELLALTNQPAMTTATANAIRRAIVNNGASLMPSATTNNFSFFNSPLDARRVTNAAATLAANKFDVTHYNHDPDTTFFNEPRIVLTTRPDRAGWTYQGGQWVGKNGLSGAAGRPAYIRILANEGTVNNPLAIPAVNDSLNPNIVAGRIDQTKLNDTINLLMDYLKKSNWPMVNGSSSLQQKYYGAYPAAYQEARLAQLAINIIDYVRCKESPSDIVEALRAEKVGSTFTIGGTPTSAFAYIGQARGPRITEVAYFQNANNTQAKWKVEIYLPRNYGLDSVQLSNYQLITLWASPTAGANPPQSFNNLSAQVLNKGSYFVVDIPYAAVNPRPAFVDGRFTLTLQSGPRTSLSPLATVGGKATQMPDPNNSYLQVPVDATSVAEADIRSLQVDDPRLNMEKRNWEISTKNTLGQVNSNSALAGSKSPLSVQPQQDTASNGMISTASFYMPPPAGRTFVLESGATDDNTLGMVTSAGELGYIHTGIESSYKDFATSVEVPTGVPWRSLRLQPNSQNASVVPDWAFMDLFTAPVAAPKGGEYVYAPGSGSPSRDNAVGGRVNLNGKPSPFEIDRVTPLTAVLQGARKNTANTTKVGATEAATLADNIYYRTLANTGKSYNYPNGFYSPGQLVEIRGIADGGEESEELVRSVGNLFTARGNVLTVYSVGQSLKQLPNGSLAVTGEQRLQAMVERFTERSGSTITTRFAPVYFRPLMP